jgi:hypothetical protein
VRRLWGRVQVLMEVGDRRFVTGLVQTVPFE